MYTISMNDGFGNTESIAIENFDRAIAEAGRNANYLERKDRFSDYEISVIRDSDNFKVWSSKDCERLKFYESHSMDEWKELETLSPLFFKAHMEPEVKSVYFDIDGVLGYFYKDGRGLKYPEEILDPNNHYFRNIEPHPFAVDLARRLVEEGIDVCVISSADRDSLRDKVEWLKEYCPFIKEDNIFFCPIGSDKARFVKGNADKSILIDDYPDNLAKWEEHGGQAKKFINSINTLDSRFPFINAIEVEKALERGERTAYDSMLSAITSLLEVQTGLPTSYIERYKEMIVREIKEFITDVPAVMSFTTSKKEEALELIDYIFDEEYTVGNKIHGAVMNLIKVIEEEFHYLVDKSTKRDKDEPYDIALNNITTAISGIYEGLLHDKGIVIPDKLREMDANEEEQAVIYGDTYKKLLERLADVTEKEVQRAAEKERRKRNNILR